MKKILLITLLLSFSVYGQRKRLADKFFKDYSYKKAAYLYQKIYKRGDSSRFVLSRLADSYYYVGDTERAEEWYKRLMKRDDADKQKDSLHAEYVFRYAQSLKANGNYAESDKWLLKFKKLRPKDSRGRSLASNPDYLLAYTKNKDSYINIHNVQANTQYSDFGTFVNDKQVFFASSRPTKGSKRIYGWNEQPFLNIYTAKQKKKPLTVKGHTIKINELDLPSVSLIPGKVNTGYHEAMGAITNDGRMMYFTRNNYTGKRLIKDKESTTNLKLYSARLIDGQWSDVRELPFNSDNYSVGAPCLSSDGKTLYFVSDMPGGYGATDIYKVDILKDNTYGKPINLGKVINTEGREMFPYVDSKGTIYFSSDGHIGLGGLDIFTSKLTKQGKYEKIYNLGVPFNSRWDDFALVFDKLDVSGYFSSNREGGKGDDDIYSFNIYECNKIITGVVTDSKTKLVLPDIKISLIGAKGKVLKSETTDSKGKYIFYKVPCDKVYTLVWDKSDYKSNREQVSTMSAIGNVVKADLELTHLIVDDQIVIDPIHFDFDKYNIREDAKVELENIVKVMNNHPQMKIRIESHTDTRGSRAYNKRLSDKRAKSTMDYIISRGIAPSRIVSAIGYGESRPLVNCKKCTEEQHQLNRRSYFYIIKKGEDTDDKKKDSNHKK